jgi:hypothetical protein
MPPSAGHSSSRIIWINLLIKPDSVRLLVIQKPAFGSYDQLHLWLSAAVCFGFYSADVLHYGITVVLIDSGQCQ